MKVETAKEKVIREAYESIGVPFHENVLYDNGWLRIRPSQYSSKYYKLDLLKLTDHTHSVRPKSLSGIESNNGWIKIESEADLPMEYINCYFILKSNNAILAGKYDEACFEYALRYYDYQEVTHYQPIQKPERPLY